MVFNPADYPMWDDRNDITRPQKPTKDEHYWVRFDEDDEYLSCAWCGRIRQRDDSNRPCVGIVRVTLR